jgi:hypothetical protein
MHPGAAQVAARPQDANLLAVYAAERRHLAKLAGSMVSSKLDEQRSMLNEKAVEQLELALTGILRDLGHDPSDLFVCQVVARRLRAVGSTDPTTRTVAAVRAAEIVSPEDAAEPVAF